MLEMSLGQVIAEYCVTNTINSTIKSLSTLKLYSREVSARYRVADTMIHATEELQATSVLKCSECWIRCGKYMQLIWKENNEQLP